MMSLSDTASTSKLQHPQGDVVVEEKPEAVMLAFMAEMREQMSSQNREIAALRQVVSVMAAPWAEPARRQTLSPPPWTERARRQMLPPPHGSSEGHEMLKRNDKYHSIADDVPIPKM